MVESSPIEAESDFPRWNRCEMDAHPVRSMDCNVAMKIPRLKPEESRGASEALKNGVLEWGKAAGDCRCVGFHASGRLQRDTCHRQGQMLYE